MSEKKDSDSGAPQAGDKVSRPPDDGTSGIASEAASHPPGASIPGTRNDAASRLPKDPTSPRPFNLDETIDAFSIPAGGLESAGDQESVAAGAPPSVPGLGGIPPSPGSPVHRLSPGQQFGPYHIERLLGQGGMGEVFEAEDEETGHRVALKILAGDADWSPTRRERFLQEGKLAASISNPHSLYVYGTDEIEGAPVIAMELALGGTLKDRVDAEGPLPITDAVEAARQMLEGLSAAHNAGILHRDVKPANSFIDRDGSVKVGDYGLSLSAGNVDATRLTMTGTLMGTPAFAPPEQMRGEKVDHRADIYSVGATLYYLLTAHLPFTGADALQVVLATLEKPAPNPRAERPEIPAGLAAVILRCLAKKPSDRYQSCEELRTALAGFGARAPQWAATGKRFVAGALDMGVLWLLSMLIFGPLLPKLLGGAVESKSSGVRLGLFVSTVVWLLYPAIAEGIFGTTVGKMVFGLQVTGPGGRAPGFPRALLRSGIFWALPLAAQLLATLHFSPDASPRPATLGLFLLETFGWAWVFLPAWRDRGAKGLHDSLTRTGVFQRPAGTGRALLIGAPVPAEMPAPGWSIGPYRVQFNPVELSPGAVVSGLDPRLRRNVWIQISTATTPPVSPERRAFSRQGRPRWLNGRRAAESSWDAYEALEGIPFLAAGSRPWSSIRLWLSDLFQEIRISQAGDTPLPVLSLDRVWLTTSGHAVLLDFPAPGLPPQLSNHPPTAYDPNESPAVQDFLYAMATTALGPAPTSLSPADPAPPAAAPSIPLPLHASRFLQDLGGRQFESTPRIGEILASIEDRDTTVKRARIALILTLIVGPVLFFAGLTGVGLSLRTKSFNARHPDLIAADWCLGQLAEMKDGSSPEQTARREALEICLAGPLRSAIGDTSAAMTTYRVISAKAARRWTRILASRPEPSLEEMRQAQALIFPTMNRERSAEPSRAAGFIAILFLTLTGLLAILLAGILRGGLLLRAFGIAVVGGDGTEVGRVRSVGRAILSWSTVPIFWVLLLRDPPTAAFAIPILLFLVGAGWSLRRPERGPAERLTGCYLVPR
jgi:hypothetical protein